MAFTLRITFSGLCLFVPEAAGGGATGRMHVLMPGMFAHHHAGPDRHLAVLSYDAGSLVKGARVLGVPTLGTLDRHVLEFGSGDTADLGLCGHIPDLKEVTGRGVDPDHLADDRQGKLMSRVTLRSGRIVGVAPGVCWEWQGGTRPIAHKVMWEIPDVEGDGLEIEARPLGGGGLARPLGMLFPTNGQLQLEVHHDTSENLPPAPLPVSRQAIPAPGDEPRHFSAFYDVFGEGVTRVLPRYREADDCPPVANPCKSLPEWMGGTPYTCLVAGVGV
jgi:hypothetical protein